MDGIEGEFESVGHPELIEDVVQMVFHSLLADEQFLADFTVAEALRDQLDDLLLAIAEQWLFPTLARFRGLLKGVDNLGGHPVVEPDFALVDFANALV